MNGFVAGQIKTVSIAVALATVAVLTITGSAKAQTYRGSALGYVAQDRMYQGQGSVYDEPAYQEPSSDEPVMRDAETPARFQRTVVSLDTREASGTIIIDTKNTYLYLVLGQGRAMRYGVGVGREGFTWAGTQSITRKAEWPDWTPPAEMIARQPYLPRFTSGGPGNPMGARAMYLGGTAYRIHGTNDPTTIGKFVSSGCIRLTNEDATDLYERVRVGAKVVVLPKQGSPSFEAQANTARHVVSGPASRPVMLRGNRSAQLSSSAIY
jgi:lipoprotein-anchoring transpeptidase ErfK/SrfK